jgi:inhibitor of KinA sporulation pathway (predicted exonuclease)
VPNKLTKINVIDVETSCWNSSEEQGDQPQEIIEIGIATLNTADWSISNEASWLIYPEKSKISKFCTDLTGITQRRVEKEGSPFAAVLRNLQLSPYHIKEHAWGSWGDFDRKAFERNCEVRGLKYPFGPTHLNMKYLYALMNGLPKELGMDDALQHARLPLVGRHHDAGDDAYNIAKLAQTIFYHAGVPVPA